ncbi:anthranilate phosphoribosyltransferase [Chloroherpeton thalassium ATCC 35110]|uniref:Anthranilate phosphoribosyltransferase n=1 Tax=Chloroherpeton thalassium (strain ATCC 35110 / GB-78) TaxID=517418 RepID=TRPD_CHLT3|nr:anthranilate phosphoribosyltransferase [Chloroherpeton thalassium]B3QUY6.1 RecName: Full=Anthranilate phosphoribosyltransferase [Chloroherpeton thalassium ATCC 35110]ACF14487.1 anthranilate phosphoribosyltransferase [Chloroherpeton thalassium ATCC 35110]
MTIEEALLGLLDGQTLISSEMESIMSEIMDGQISPIKIAAFLVLLRQRGEEVEEIYGAARAILNHAEQPILEGDPIDTCGTGGDGANTFNISTAASLIAHACGVKVAKHGNRSISSRCGSADVLEAMGFKIDLPKKETEELFKETGFVFLFAPIFHKAMKNVAPVRKELGLRTIFNMLGPLINPARTQRQIIGVYSKDLTGMFAQVLRQFDAKHCLILHGQTDEGGILDEPSVCGPTYISELQHGTVRTYTVHPEDFGLRRHSISQLKGGDARENAQIIWQILDKNGPEAREDAVVFTAGMACYVAELTPSIKEGIDKARQAIHSGAAKQSVERLLEKHRNLVI